MNTRKAFITVGLMLASLTMLPVAHADDWDQASKLTFSQSVQIPGRVLPAGTYWFVLADSVGNRNIIQVFNSDRSTLYATVLAVTAERPQATDNTTITLAERESMPTNAIVTWFYPGRNSGHEFVYSKSEEQELARATHQTTMATAPAKNQTAGSGD
jgi:hypothetical protein